jgi:hypothetical protein
MALTGIGFVTFLSFFVTGVMNFGNFENFEGQARSAGIRGFGGIVLVIIGAALMNIGAKGWAGSGVVLDPNRARKDVEPWSRMGGGILNDALSEVEVAKKLEERLEPPAAQVKIRCRQCQALNDEKAKFCDQCSAAL